ncbi:MAG: ATP-binding cassette domain-containing protein [Bacteroidetes bacterium]|jgi:ABC-2 type transport system ATP-binding protein|nr:ATP-binding cassette domain-containing protein [Bacteroidota bacterium]
MSTVIEAIDICKTFGEQRVSKNISLAVREGSIYGLLGPNGAGKTTLIRMLSTITQPDSGEIRFRGDALKEVHAHQMGYMPEERGLYKKMTVAEQLLFFAELRGLSNRDAKAAVKHWLQRLDMMDWARKKVEEISKGMAQKVQFVSCVLHNPKLLILDEPFSGFDPVNADLIKDLILELKRGGTSVIFSTHRMDNVESLCDHLAIIHKGEKVLDGSVSEIRRNHFTGMYDVGYHEEVVWDLGEAAPLSMEKNSDGKVVYRFQTSEVFTPEHLLSAAMLKGKLVHYTEHIPSIHEIFVDTVSKGGAPIAL